MQIYYLKFDSYIKDSYNCQNIVLTGQNQQVSNHIEYDDRSDPKSKFEQKVQIRFPNRPKMVECKNNMGYIWL